jgi:hypothetical protein
MNLTGEEPRHHSDKAVASRDLAMLEGIGNSLPPVSEARDGQRSTLSPTDTHSPKRGVGSTS